MNEALAGLDSGCLCKYSALNNLGRSRRSVIKQDIVRKVADNMELTKVKAEQAVDSVFLALKSAMKVGERIELRGFGVFVVKPRKSGIGRNPRTGDEVPIPPGKTVRFKPGKELRSNEIP